MLDTDISEVGGHGYAGFRPNGRYRVTIRVDERVRWNRTVKHFEHYELEIESNGTVTIVSHSVA